MLTQETFNAIINYLATKPYSEVHSLFMMIQNDIDESNKKQITAIEEENNE